MHRTAECCPHARDWRPVVEEGSCVPVTGTSSEEERDQSRNWRGSAVSGTDCSPDVRGMTRLQTVIAPGNDLPVTQCMSRCYSAERERTFE